MSDFYLYYSFIFRIIKPTHKIFNITIQYIIAILLMALVVTG